MLQSRPRELSDSKVKTVSADVDRKGATRIEVKEHPSYAITGTEATWGSETLVKLNTDVRKAARNHKWTLVDGIADAFRSHGYCATRDRWIMHYEESDTEQHDAKGTLHPNMEGHRVGYAARLSAAWRTPCGSLS